MGQLDETVRKRLTHLRMTRRFSQETVGRAVGWTQTSVSKYEHGDFSADLDTLVRFAAFYDVPFAELLQGEGPKPPEDPERQAVLDAYTKLTPDQKRALVVMLDAVVGAAPRSGDGRRSLPRPTATTRASRGAGARRMRDTT